MGYFNKAKNGTIPTTYFKVVPKGGGTTLDMTGWVLPPIGTSSNPFVGNFDGNGVTIKGFTTSNSANRSAYIDSKGNVHTPEILTTVTGVEIIGMFGVVGYTEEGKQTHSYSSQANEVKNFHIYDAKIKTQTSSSLVGIGAGYVNGTLSKIGVVDSSITDLTGASALSSTDYTDKLSDYSLVGYCEEAYLDTYDVRTVEISKPKRSYTQTSEVEPGIGFAWGNSIYMGEFYTRMNNIKNNLAAAVKYYSESTEYRYEEGYIEVEPAAGATEYSNSYITNYTNNLAGTGSATFTEESSQSIFAAEDFFLFGYTRFRPGTVIRHIYEVYYKTNAIKIQSGSYYLNVGKNAQGTAIIQAETRNATGWSFSNVEGKQGSLSTEADGVTYYLNISGTSLVLGTNPNSTTYWYYTDDEIYAKGSNGVYYYIKLDGTTWKILQETSSTYYIKQGSNYLSLDGTMITNTTSESQATKWTMAGSNTSMTVYGGSGLYLYADGTSLTTTSTTPTTFTMAVSGSNFGLESGIYRVAFSNGLWKMVEKDVDGYYYYDKGSEGDTYYLTLNSSNQIAKTTSKSSAKIWRNTNTNMDPWTTSAWYAIGTDGQRYYIGTGSRSGMYLKITTTTSQSSARPVKINDDNDNLYFHDNNREIMSPAYNWYIKYIPNNIWHPSAYKGNFAFYQTVASGNAGYEIVRKSTYNLSRTVTNNPNASKLTVTEIKDKEKYYIPLPDDYYYSTPDTYVPISAATTAPYGVNNNNTGYFTSGTYNMGNMHGGVGDHLTDAGDLRVSSNNVNAGWLDYSVSGFWGTQYNPENLEIVTPQKQSNGKCLYVRIEDDMNKNHDMTWAIINGIQYRYQNKVNYNDLGLQRYYTARTNIDKIFASNNNYYGLWFYNSVVSASNKFVARNISVLNHGQMPETPFPYYEMLRDCVEFNVQTPGYLNMFAATYHYDAETFYSLHQVFRDENNKILSTKTISKVYKIDSTHFFYQYSTGEYSISHSYSSAQLLDMLVFDMDWMINPNNGEYIQGNWWSTTTHTSRTELLEETLYYFEIPLMPGEYALGSSGNGYGAHLVYLDIGANSQAITTTDTNEVVKDTIDTYAAPKGIAFQESVSNTLPTECDGAIGLAAGGTAGDVITYDRVGNTITASKRNGNTITYNKEGVTIKNADNSAMTTTPYHSVSTLTNTKEHIKKNADADIEIERTKTVVVEIIEDGVLKSRTKTVNGEPHTPTDADAIVQGDVAIKYHYYIPTGDLIRSITLAMINGTDADNNIEFRYEIFEQSENISFNIYVDSLVPNTNGSWINRYLMKDYSIIPGLRADEYVPTGE